jgi:hypothetical protein
MVFGGVLVDSSRPIMAQKTALHQRVELPAPHGSAPGEPVKKPGAVSQSHNTGFQMLPDNLCSVLPGNQTRAAFSTAFKVALGRMTALHFSASAL